MRQHFRKAAKLWRLVKCFFTCGTEPALLDDGSYRCVKCNADWGNPV